MLGAVWDGLIGVIPDRVPRLCIYLAHQCYCVPFKNLLRTHSEFCLIWEDREQCSALLSCQHLYGVFHLVGILGDLQPLHAQCQLQGIISHTRYDIFPQHILLMSLSAKDPRRFYADSQKCYHHFFFLCRKTGRRSNQVKIALWVVPVLCARPSHGSPKLWWHRRKRNREIYSFWRSGTEKSTI